MKIRPLILVLALLASHAFAQTPPVAPPDSPELKTQKLRYTSDLQAAREPIRARYVTALGALLQAKKGAGDLDAAIAIDNAIAAAKGKPGSESPGMPCEELLALKGRTTVEMQTALEAIQTRYLAALEALQVSFTQRGNLTAALAVRNEVKAIKEASPNSSSAVSNENPLGVAGSATAVNKDPAVGRWKWMNSDKLMSLNANGEAEHGARRGKWVCRNPKETPRTYVITWTTDTIVDTLSLIRDGNELSGENQGHNRIWATRVAEASTQAPAAPSGLSPLDRGGSSLIGDKPATGQNDASAIAGKWRITYTRTGSSHIKEFFQNHTWKQPGDRSSAGKQWEIENDKLIMKFPDGGREWFILPIDPNGTKGRTGAGVEFTAVRESR